MARVKKKERQQLLLQQVKEKPFLTDEELAQKLSVSVLSNAPWVSAIDRTGQSLAAPFLAAPPGTPTLPCPVAGCWC